MTSHSPEPHTRSNILIVSSEFPPGPGGIGTHAFSIADGLHRLGHRVRVLGSQDYVSDEDATAFRNDAPFPVTRFAATDRHIGRLCARTYQFHQELRQYRPDVVIASGRRSLWLASLVAPLFRIPYVAVVHGSELRLPRWSRAFTRFSFRRASRVVAVSDTTRNRVIAASHDPARIVVITNGADPARFAPDSEGAARFRAVFGLGDRPIVSTVGNITYRKGQHAVVAALPLLMEHVPEVMYVVVGLETEATVLRHRAEALGVADHLTITGPLDASQVVDAHNAADVFALTSVDTSSGDVEGFGLAVLEAALCETPAVVSRGTGAEETVVEGVTGRTVDATDPSSVANALADLLCNPTLRETMGRAAREHALCDADWESSVAAYEEVLRHVLESHGSSR